MTRVSYGDFCGSSYGSRQPYHQVQRCGGAWRKHCVTSCGQNVSTAKDSQVSYLTSFFRTLGFARDGPNYRMGLLLLIVFVTLWTPIALIVLGEGVQSRVAVREAELH